VEQNELKLEVADGVWIKVLRASILEVRDKCDAAAFVETLSTPDAGQL